MPDRPPNILLVMADQMSALSMRAWDPRSTALTPNLDRLAAEGARFENAYCNYPLCAPARFAMMAGRLPSAIGAYDNAAEFPAKVPTIAHYLRALGYYTCLSGKMHFVGPDQLHGFEDRLTTEIYPADFGWTPRLTYDTGVDDQPKEQAAAGVSSVESIADARAVARSMQLDYDAEVAHRALAHLFELRRRETRPFFLTVSFTQPHDPYVITAEHWDRYETRGVNPPRVAPVPLDALDPHSHGLHFHYGLDRFAIDDATTLRARRGYYGMMSWIDDRVGDLLGALSDCGLAENTLVVFTSDHGDMMGERGMWFKKTLFEPAIRVPLIVRDPSGRIRGRREVPVSLVDLLPTLHVAAGGTPETRVTETDGASLFELDEGRADSRAVYVEHLEGATAAPRVMVRRGRHKYVHSEAYPPQLYDLEADPDERANLAEDAAAAGVRAEMQALVEARWDLPRLAREVAADHRVRRFVADALALGRAEAWERESTVPTADRFVRRGDLFPEVEQRGHVDYARDVR